MSCRICKKFDTRIEVEYDVNAGSVAVFPPEMDQLIIERDRQDGSGARSMKLKCPGCNGKFSYRLSMPGGSGDAMATTIRESIEPIG